jgi:hypothetical protein
MEGHMEALFAERGDSSRTYFATASVPLTGSVITSVFARPGTGLLAGCRQGERFSGGAGDRHYLVGIPYGESLWIFYAYIDPRIRYQ